MVFGLPKAPKISHFVGREAELAEMERIFQPANKSPEIIEQKVMILHGLGGIGKTQLAIAFVKRHRDVYTAIFWLNGQTEDTLRSAFEDMARRLYQEHPNSTLLRSAMGTRDIDDIVDLTKRWFSVRGNTKWMLVFDNIDNPTYPGHQDSQAYDLKAYLPDAAQGNIIVTTRSSQLENLGETLSVRKIGDVQERFEILMNTSGRKNVSHGMFSRSYI